MKNEPKEKEKEEKETRKSSRKHREGKEKREKKSSSSKKKKEDKDGKRKEKREKRKEKEAKEEKSQEGAQKEEPFGAPRIDPAEIKLRDKKGQGCFGTVWAGSCRGTNVAVKIPNENRKISAAALEEFAREIELMSKIFSPNINLFMGACLEIGNIMIVTELMTGNVEQLLHSKTPLSLTCRMKMARDAAQGMAWLHGSNPTIIHRDLKSSNLLFTEKEGHYTIKVCDFGLSQLFDKGDMLRDGDQVFGSPLWMAPEVMVRDEFNEKADVYSFGIVLWELLTREPPFSHHSDLLTFRKAICGEGERPPIPKDTIKSLRNLMEISWNADPKIRPGFNPQVKELEGIIVDAAISDCLGRVFWKENFVDEDAVSNPREAVLLEHFLADFYQFLESDPIPLADNVTDEELLSASPSQLKEFSARGNSHFTRVYDAFELNGQDIGDLEIDTEMLLEEVEWRCLKEVLAEEAKRNDGSEVVRMERFGEILAWFGPLEIQKGGVIGVGSFLWTLKSILETGWFFGPVSGKAAIIHLKDKPPGTFLVRYSSQPGWFAISSVNSKKTIAHYRIEHEPGSKTFRLEGTKAETYSSLIELVEAVSESLYLVNPCENSPYHHIFIGDEKKNQPNLMYSVATFS